MALVPSEHLSANEVAAAKVANQGERFNPQQQFQVTWPAEPVVAGAYIDQLQRGGELSQSLLADLNNALERSATKFESGASDEDLAKNLEMLSMALNDIGGDAITNKRRAGLSKTLNGIAARLR